MSNTMSSTSEGIIFDVNTKDASCVAPLWAGKYLLEKFISVSSINITHASSPSASLLSRQWYIGWAKKHCVSENPIILATTAAEVCGLIPVTNCPAKSSGFFKL